MVCTLCFLIYCFVFSQQEQKELLKRGLAGLPAPKNDYEIVIPESEDQQTEDGTEKEDYVEDQADLDARREQELLEKR